MNYFNITHILLSAILLLAGNNVEAVESQLRGGSDERKLQDNRLVGEYVLDMVNTRNTQPYYPQGGDSGDDFIAYGESASFSGTGDGGPYFHDTTITRTNPNRNCQTCIFEFKMDLDPRAVGGNVSIGALIQLNRNNGQATITNVSTNTNNIGVRTEAIMNALRTTEYIAGGDKPAFFGDTRNGSYQSQLRFSTEGQRSDDDFIAYLDLPTGVVNANFGN